MFFSLIIIILFVAIALFVLNRFYAYIFLIPLAVYSQSSTLVSIGSTSINLGLDTVYICGVLLMELVLNRNLSIKLNKVTLSLLAFWLYVLFNILFVAISYNKFQTSSFLVFFRLFQYVVVFVIISNLHIDERRSIVVFFVFIATGVIASIHAIFQKLSGDYSFTKGIPSFTVGVFRDINSGEDVNLENISANYNVFAAFLVLSIMLSIGILLMRDSIFLYKRIVYIVAPVLLVGLYLASSRAAFLAIFSGVMYLSWRRSMFFFIKMGLASMLIILFTVVMFSENEFIGSFVEIFTKYDVALPYVMDSTPWRSDMGFGGTTMGAIQRIFGFLEAMRVFSSYPIFGCGFNMFLTESLFYPENLFLQLLAETGLLGFSLFGLFIFRLFTDSRYTSFNSGFSVYYSAIFRAIIIGMIVINLTGNLFYTQKTLGPFLLLCGFFFAYKRKQGIKLVNN